MLYYCQKVSSTEEYHKVLSSALNQGFLFMNGSRVDTTMYHYNHFPFYVKIINNKITISTYG